MVGPLSLDGYSSPSLIIPSLLQWKGGLIIGVVSLEGANLVHVILYYLIESEIWPDKVRWLLMLMAVPEGNYVIFVFYLFEIICDCCMYNKQCGQI